MTGGESPKGYGGRHRWFPLGGGRNINLFEVLGRVTQIKEDLSYSRTDVEGLREFVFEGVVQCVLKPQNPPSRERLPDGPSTLRSLTFELDL